MRLLWIAGLFTYSRACSKLVIAEVSRQRLFDRLILCAVDSFFVGFTACVEQFPGIMISQFDLVEDLCIECITSLVNHVASNRDAVDLKCQTQPSSAACLRSGIIQEALASFQRCSGVSIMYPSCRSSEVRASAESRTIGLIFEAALNQTPNVPALAVPFSSCAVCYYQFADSLFTGAKTSPNIEDSVKLCNDSSISSSECRDGIQNFLSDFANCAGYDIYRFGPECKPSEVSAIEALQPYRELSICAFAPEKPACESLGSFYEDITSLSNEECSLCYLEYFDQVVTESATLAAGSVCDNIDSPDCLSWNSKSLSYLEYCRSGPA